MALIVLTSKKFFNKFISQPDLSGVINYETTKELVEVVPSFGVGRKPSQPGIHGSSQNNILLPSPIMRQAHLDRILFVQSRLFQIHEAMGLG